MTPPTGDAAAFLAALGAMLARSAPGPSPPADPPLAEVLTVAEVARFLRVDRKTVYESIRRGDLPSRRVGRRLVVGRDALRAWLGRGA